jgi:hypothetical protein
MPEDGKSIFRTAVEFDVSPEAAKHVRHSDMEKHYPVPGG